MSDTTQARLAETLATIQAAVDWIGTLAILVPGAPLHYRNAGIALAELARVAREAAELPPYFGLEELRLLRNAFRGAQMYIGPVGLSDHATAAWREAQHWLVRLDSLIEEFAECEEAALAAEGRADR